MGGGVVLPNVSVAKDDLTKVYYNPYVDPYGGHDYVEIGGVKWATMNVGANSITDSGLYFAWGETQGYTVEQVPSEKAFSWDDYKWTEDGGNNFTKYNGIDGKLVLDPEDDAVTAAWGGNWRMPTHEEYQALVNATTNQRVENYNGSEVNGILFTSKDNSSKTLFFPVTDDNRGVNGSSYWSRSRKTDNRFHSWYLYITNPNVTMSRCIGLLVRGVFG